MIGMLKEPEVTGRNQAGRFEPGRSGNPSGRPKGSRNRATKLCEDLLGEDAEEVMQACIRRAKAGDGVALRLCIERLVPIRAARDRAVELPAFDVGKVGDLAAAAAAVIARAAAGEITLSEAREFMTLLDVQRRIMETADLAVRLEALEGSRPAADDEAGDPRERVLAIVRERLRLEER